MADHGPDTPGSEPGEAHALRAKARGGDRRHNLDDGSDGVHSNGFDRQEQAVFDLSMDYSDDDTLLDWEQYAGNRRVRCCGCDVSWLQRCLPCLPWVPPEWWYKYSRRQRKLFGLACVMATVILTLILVSISIIIVFTDVTTTASNLRTEDLPECQWADWRLPQNVTPTAYNLRLQTDLQDPFAVTGSVEIELKINQPTLCVVISAAALTITNASLLSPAVPGNVTLNSTYEQATIRFDSAVRSNLGTRTMALNFTYTLSQGLSGFYRSTPAGPGGQASTLATTQFEASAARRAFPCFDEPALKAAFRLTLTAPAGQTVLFNMPELSATPVAGNLVAHSFQATPPMSTYLVAFIVGNLQSVETTVPAPSGGTSRPVRVWGTPARAQDLQVALDTAARLLPAYEERLQVPYALPKLDLVAIPDFAAGAMENWGLITFRETDLLATNASGVLGVQRVTSVIAHEMAHLWFGDLVTCDYWNEIWLNEGFATYWQAVAGDAVSPEQDYLGTFYSDDATLALDVDARPLSTHPLSVADGVLNSSAGIEAMFDGISYQKGGAVLRMLRAYLNRDTSPKPMLRRRLFQAAAAQDPWLQALQAYLQANRYQTATAAKLWAAFNEATGEDVAQWMQPWTYRSGYPLVNVTLGGASGRDVMVSQANFTIGGVQPCVGTDTAAVNGPWWLPVSFQHEGSDAVEWHVFSECSHHHAVTTLQSASSWVKLNVGQYGVFRVNYPTALWQRLAGAANATASPLAPADLAGLLDDAFALSLTGDSPIDTFLSLTSTLSMRNISEVSPWQTGADYLALIDRRLGQDPANAACRARLQRYVQGSVVRPGLAALARASTQLAASQPSNRSSAAAQLAWAATGVLSKNYTQPTTTAAIRIVRTTVVGLAKELNDSSIAAEATRLAALAVAPRSSAQAPAPEDGVDADLRGSIYAASVAMGNSSAWDRMQRHYLAATDATEKARSLLALSYASSASDVARTLDYALRAEVKSQDVRTLIVATAARSSTNLQLAWAFLRTHWSDLVGKLGGDDEAGRTMGALLSSLGARFASENAVAQVEALYNEHADLLKEPRYLTQAKESIAANVAWSQRNSAPACAWLSARGV